MFPHKDGWFHVCRDSGKKFSHVAVPEGLPIEPPKKNAEAGRSELFELLRRTKEEAYRLSLAEDSAQLKRTTREIEKPHSPH
jgi:hypothetical protein